MRLSAALFVGEHRRPARRSNGLHGCRAHLSALYLLWQVVAEGTHEYAICRMLHDRTILWTAVLAAGFVLALAISRLLPVQLHDGPRVGRLRAPHPDRATPARKRGLFQSWPPYAPIDSFTYHFGFHANMAVWATVTGQTAPQALIRAASFLTSWPCWRSTRSPFVSAAAGAAGVAALFVAGCSPCSRETMSTGAATLNWPGQVILPAWLWAMDVWWTETKAASARASSR